MGFPSSAAAAATSSAITRSTMARFSCRAASRYPSRTRNPTAAPPAVSANTITLRPQLIRKKRRKKKMYEEVSDEVAVASDAYADVGVSGSGYYSATDDYNSGGISSSSETLNNSVNSTILNNGVKEEPEFLRQDRLQKAAIEAARTKASFMTYRESPMFRRMSEGFEEATGSWNERFQALIDMEDSFEKYDKLRSTVSFFSLFFFFFLLLFFIGS